MTIEEFLANHADCAVVKMAPKKDAAIFTFYIGDQEYILYAGLTKEKDIKFITVHKII